MHIQYEIDHFERRFNQLKQECIEGLLRRHVSVVRVATALTNMRADDMDENRQFLESHFTRPMINLSSLDN